MTGDQHMAAFFGRQRQFFQDRLWCAVEAFDRFNTQATVAAFRTRRDG